MTETQHPSAHRSAVLWEKWDSLLQSVMSQGWLPEAPGQSGGKDLKTTPLLPGNGVRCNTAAVSVCLEVGGTPCKLHRSTFPTCCFFWMCHPEGGREAVQPARCFLPAELLTCTLVMAFPSAWCCLWEVPETSLFVGHRELLHSVRGLLQTWCDQQGWVTQQPCFWSCVALLCCSHAEHFS